MVLLIFGIKADALLSVNAIFIALSIKIVRF
jgi:hypothetical protein